jgi:hypothetical protein
MVKTDARSEILMAEYCTSEFLRYVTEMRKPDHMTLIVHERFSDNEPDLDSGMLAAMLAKTPIRRRAADGSVTWIYALDDRDSALAR